MSRYPVGLALISAGLVASCDGGVIPEPPAPGAVLSVVIRRSTNAPVDGAVVRVVVMDTLRGLTVMNEAAGTTDGDGTLRRAVYLDLFHPSFIGRVQLTVHPPTTFALPDSTLDAGIVAFKPYGVVLDTLAVTIVYP